MNLNFNALQRAERLLRRAAEYRVDMHEIAVVRVLDCGVQATGGLQAGLGLAEVCLADLADVRFQPPPTSGGTLSVSVCTDQPVAACMASQYAGWQVMDEENKFFAMGSGPMRAAAGLETLFQDIGCREQADHVVGVLECHQLPGADVCTSLARDCGVTPAKLTLLVAPASSLAGSVQVVARTVETALHKLHELKFDLNQVCSGFGVAPLPPVAADGIQAIGRTNDAVLYGGQVTLWVDADDEAIAEVGPRVPSESSPDHGRPFVEIFERYNRDFYQIDPLLFSPAVVTLVNLRSGRSRRFGRLEADVLEESFGI